LANLKIHKPISGQNHSITSDLTVSAYYNIFRHRCHRLSSEHLRKDSFELLLKGLESDLTNLARKFREKKPELDKQMKFIAKSKSQFGAGYDLELMVDWNTETASIKMLKPK